MEDKDKYLSRHFNKECWLAENGGDDLVIPTSRSKCSQFASYTKRGLLANLESFQKGLQDEALVQETYYYESSMAAGIEIYKHFTTDENSHVTLVAQTQSGKTSAIFAIFSLAKIHHPTIKHFVYISMPAARELGKQSTMRLSPLPKVVCGRGCLSNIHKNSKYWHSKWKECGDDEQKRQKFKEEVLITQKRAGNDWLAAPVILDDTLLVIDESHFGAGIRSQISQVLQLWGVPTNMDPNMWPANNVKVVTSSATPHAEIASSASRPWQKVVVMRPGEGYIGLPEFMCHGKVHSSWPLEDDKSVLRLVERAIEPDMLGTGIGSGFGIVRRKRKSNQGLDLQIVLVTTLQNKDWKVKEGIPGPGDEKYYDIAIVEYDQEHKSQEMEDFLTTPTSKVAIKGMWLSNKPIIPTIILLKEKCKLGDTISNEWIKLVFERVKTMKNDPGFHEQSLAGRMTGYKTHMPKVYAHDESIRDAVAHIDAGYKAETTPRGSKYTRKRIKSGYPALSLTLDLNNMSEQEREAVLHEGRYQNMQGKELSYKAVLRESLSAATDPLKQKLNSLGKSRARKYSLWNWSDRDDRNYVHPPEGEEIQQNHAYFQYAAACVFVNKGPNNTLKVSWYFANEKITTQSVSVHYKSMYSVAAK